MTLPKAFSVQPRAARIVGAVVLPALLGAMTGLALGASSAVYWILSLVAFAGGLLAGLEHERGLEGLGRGLLGGTLFGAFTLLVHELSGATANVELEDPAGVHVVVTAVIGAVLGAVGAMVRSRARERSARP